MSTQLAIPAPLSVNWDDVEKIWHHAFYNELRVAPEEHAVLLSESPFTPRANREKAVQIMFETFNVPLFYSCLAQVMSCYAAGRTTSVVVDSGYGNTYVVCVYESYSLAYATRTLDVGGNDLTEFLQQCLNKSSGCQFSTTAEMRIVKDIKDIRLFDLDSSRRKEYSLPDGQKISVGAEMFRVPEAMFQPKFIESDCAALQDLIIDSVNQCEPSIHKDLFGSIVLSGGNTLFSNFGDRLTAELKNSNAKHAVRVISSPDRKYFTWIGGSILGSLSTFPKMCISKETYDEYGPSIVHRKCLQ